LGADGDRFESRADWEDQVSVCLSSTVYRPPPFKRGIGEGRRIDSVKLRRPVTSPGAKGYRVTGNDTPLCPLFFPLCDHVCVSLDVTTRNSVKDLPVITSGLGVPAYDSDRDDLPYYPRTESVKTPVFSSSMCRACDCCNCDKVHYQLRSCLRLQLKLSKTLVHFSVPRTVTDGETSQTSS
ncbi:hypothetical protein BaRGS_00022897, partial [Batillaria attramentaria]